MCKPEGQVCRNPGFPSEAAWLLGLPHGQRSAARLTPAQQWVPVLAHLFRTLPEGAVSLRHEWQGRGCDWSSVPYAQGGLLKESSHVVLLSLFLAWGL